jgi:dGTPase
MSPQILEATNNLRDFLFDKVYNVNSIQEETEKSREILRLLYKYFNEHEDSLPAEYRFDGGEIEQGLVDYIAGMTDQYTMRKAEELALTKTVAR